MKPTACSFLIVLPLLAIACEKPDELEVKFAAPTFTLTNQNNEPFGSEQLKGKTWIATLFFTSCPGPCPMMVNRLRAIQDAVKDPELRIVSISCDPANDTPDKLKEYAGMRGADPQRWFFLTGTPDAVRKVASSFYLDFTPATATEPVQHSTQFLLIDKKGQVRGIYHHDDEESMKKLSADAAKLARQQT